MNDAEATADAGHVDDGARSARQHPRQQSQGHPHRGKEVDPHDLLHLGRPQRAHFPTFRDRGVVDQHVDAAHRLPGLQSQPGGPGGVAEIGHPHHRLRRGLAAIGQDLLEPVAPTGDQPDRRAAGGQHSGQGRADPGRCTRDQYPPAGHRVRHASRLPRANSARGRFRQESGSDRGTWLTGVMAGPRGASHRIFARSSANADRPKACYTI